MIAGLRTESRTRDLPIKKQDCDWKYLAIPFIASLTNHKNRDSSVGIALGYRLDDRGSGFRFQVGAGNISVHHCVQTDSEAHPASYPNGTRGSFPGGKAAGVLS
jgi:hypothetical protein